MLLTKSTASVLALVGSASAVAIPNNDGFPNPNTDQKLAIAKQAGGLLPSIDLPTKLGPASTTTFQLIRFNELFETAFYDSLITNVTKGVDGFKVYQHKDKLLKILTTIRDQEEQHALAAEGSLKTAGASFIPSACQYQFPTKNLAGAINLAETFTAVVLGALQGANLNFAKESAPVPIQIVSSVIGQEGEQNGFFRNLLKEVPSESPFLTHVPAPFAFTALQNFVVPNSCPYPLSNINLPILAGLAVNGGPIANIKPKDQTLSFNADLTNVDKAKPFAGTDGANKLFLTYSTGQQKPISVAISNVKWDGLKISFSAEFPFEKNVMQGFSLGALTIGNNFTAVDDIVPSTLAAPALIQVQNKSEDHKLSYN